MKNEPCGDFTGRDAKRDFHDDSCVNCGWMEGDHKGSEELNQEWMDDTEHNKNKELAAQLIEAMGHQQKLVLLLADTVVGIVREEYAKNLMHLEQVGQLPELVRINEVLLDKMTEIMVERSLMGQPALRKMPQAAVEKGIRNGIEVSVEEYIKGMSDAPR